MKNIRVLVACEESQAVALEFRKLGIEAYSCDILDCSGGHPEWHIKGDVLEQLNKGWDAIIAFPPCTYLTVTANRWFNVEKLGDYAVEKLKLREQGIDFFKQIADADCENICIENPVGIMSTVWRKPDQIISPWMFGDNTEKKTCLWLKGFPKLKPDTLVKPDIEYFEWVDSKGRHKRQSLWYYKTRCLPHKDRAKAASKTFAGIAKAIAIQWTDYLKSK